MTAVEHNIAEGEPGLAADNAIEVDDSDEDELDSMLVQGDSARAPEPQVDGEVGASRSEGPSAERLRTIALLEVRGGLVDWHSLLTIICPQQARREERRAQDRREQELMDRLQAGDSIAEEDIKRELKRSASMEPSIKAEDGNEAKKCKVQVKEETVDGLLSLRSRTNEVA